VRPVPWKPIAISGAILGAIGVAVLVARKKTTPTAAQRVALIGDSYAVGLGPELAKLIPDFKYEGHVGTNTSQWANHSSACGTCGDWLTAYKPGVVLVSLGVNDGMKPDSANYQRIVQGLQKIGAKVVWIEPPADVSTPAVRATIASLGVQTVQATRTPLAGDHLHPRSYSQWAQEVAQEVNSNA
jgi:lysophospholipase L1-like esterase